MTTCNVLYETLRLYRHLSVFCIDLDLLQYWGAQFYFCFRSYWFLFSTGVSLECRGLVHLSLLSVRVKYLRTVQITYCKTFTQVVLELVTFHSNVSLLLLKYGFQVLLRYWHSFVIFMTRHCLFSFFEYKSTKTLIDYGIRVLKTPETNIQVI